MRTLLKFTWRNAIFFASRQIRESFHGLQTEMNLNFKTERCVTHA